MRRFLGANLHINTGSSTSSSPSTSDDNHNQTAAATPLLSTKRAFQHTFGQLQLSRGNSGSSQSATPTYGHPQPNQQQQQHDTSSSIASPSSQSALVSPLPTNSPVPPTPPSKHGHGEQDTEEYDDSSWDDALKLPFGHSSSSSSILSRASSSASSASPYDGVIERTSSMHNKHGIDEEEQDDDSDHIAQPGHRTSTATISASRPNNMIVSPPLSPPNTDHHAPSTSQSQSMLFSNTQQSSTSAITAASNNINNAKNRNERGLAVSATYAANASSLVDLKDEMMLELLSSDALIHVSQFEILGFDEVEELRKEHSILSNRLESLQSKLVIETKIRNAALSISQLYSSKRLSHKQKQSAEEELNKADKKVDSITNELNKLFRKESEIRNRINRHMAAVLALSFRKLEANYTGTPAVTSFNASRNGNGYGTGQFYPSTSTNSNANGTGTAPSSVASSHTGPYTPLSPSFPPGSGPFNQKSANPSPERQDFLSPNALYSPTFSTGSSSSASRNARVQAFEGPHFFANNRDAIVPGSSMTSTSTSASASKTPSATPSRSPSFTQLALFASSSVSSSAHSRHTPSIHSKSPAHSSSSDIPLPLPSPALSTNSTTLGYMDTSGLETQLAEMTSQINQSKLHSIELQNTIDLLKAEKKDLVLRLEELARSGSKESESSSRLLHDSQAENQRLKSELEKAQVRIEENIKDAGLWEDQSRKLRDEFENERRDMAARLKSTLSKYSNGERSSLAKFLPDSDRIQSLDMTNFVSRNLEDILSSMDEAHARMLDENSKLQDQFLAHQQNSQQTDNKNADEVRSTKRQIDQLQQEKQILMKKITRIESENSELHTSLKNLNDEFEDVKARHESLKERYEISASQQLDSERRMAQKIKEVDKVHTERMLEKEKALAFADNDKNSIRNRLEGLQNELQEVRNEKAAFVQSLRDVWKNMPSDAAIQARLALKDTDDVMKFKAVYLSSATTPKLDDPTGSSFTPDKLAKRVQGLLESDGKVISRLAAHEDHAASHKAASIRAEKLLQESKVSLQAYSTQVKELEERMSKTDEKEVEMLERLNDLSSALETARANTKKTELNVQNLQKKCVAFEKEKDTLNKKIGVLEKEKEKLSNKQEHKLKIANLEKEVADLKEELASAQDELDDLRTRESKQRIQLLDELTQLTEEASSLRGQLRTAQRKLAAAER